MKKMICLALLASLLTGCTSNEQEVEIQSEQEETIEDDSGMFTSRDLSFDYTITETIDVADADADSITIENEGTYELTGENEDLMIIIEASEDAKIELVLNGVTIENPDGPCIYVKSANKVFVTTVEDTVNALANGGSYTLIDENNLDGVIFSKSDLTLKGKGTLNITAMMGNAIVSKDDLVCASGTYTLSAASHALDANNSIRIASGTYTLEAGEDAIHSEHDEDESLGFVYIGNGSLTIQAQDDAIHASSSVTINDGNIDVESSYEGIEGLMIEINGGTVDVNASDDGMNAAGGNDNSQNEGPFGGNDMFATTDNAYIKINGGTVVVNAQGDGLDSNGSLYITGGYTVIYGPTNGANGTLDYGLEGSITGGTIIGLGSSEMVQTLSSETQGVMLINTSGNTGSTVSLSDAEGNTILECVGEKAFSSILLSSPDIVLNESYTLDVDGTGQVIEMTSLNYGNTPMGFDQGPGRM